MKSEKSAVSLKEASDQMILEEAAARLQTQFTRDHGTRLLYGTFRFLFHDGRFQGVEDWPRNRSYVSPKKDKEERPDFRQNDGGLNGKRD